MNQGDLALARAILQIDVAGVNAALEAGAVVHKKPFQQISWSLLPVCVSMQRRGPARAVTDDVRAIMHALMRHGAPTIGLASLFDAGVHLGPEDVMVFLDNWLQRDETGRRGVLQMVGEDDAMLSALTQAEYVPLDLVMASGQRVLQHALERDMAATVHALCARGAKPNVTVLHGLLGEVPAVEACVREGHLRSALALLAAGAAYDRRRLERCAAAHSELAARTLCDCLDAVEKGRVQGFDQMLQLPALKFFLDALAAPVVEPKSRVAHRAAIEACCVAFTQQVAKWDRAAG